ncbi:MAG: hypothetical protein ACLVJ6_11760 [Merdibacter sp.]
MAAVCASREERLAIDPPAARYQIIHAVDLLDPIYAAMYSARGAGRFKVIDTDLAESG